MKKKGYLLLDITVGLAIISIFSVAIFSIFQSYLNLKKEKAYNEFIYFIVQDIENNLTYYNLELINVGEYYIRTNNIKELKEKHIMECLTTEEVTNGNRIIIKESNESYIELDLVTSSNENIGFIKFRGIT